MFDGLTATFSWTLWSYLDVSAMGSIPTNGEMSVTAWLTYYLTAIILLFVLTLKSIAPRPCFLRSFSAISGKFFSLGILTVPTIYIALFFNSSASSREVKKLAVKILQLCPLERLSHKLYTTWEDILRSLEISCYFYLGKYRNRIKVQTHHFYPIF